MHVYTRVFFGAVCVAAEETHACTHTENLAHEHTRKYARTTTYKDMHMHAFSALTHARTPTLTHIGLHTSK
jgi:hypothetical protein